MALSFGGGVLSLPGLHIIQHNVGFVKSEYRCTVGIYRSIMASTSTESAAPIAGTTSNIKPSELNVFHRNARIGDVDAIAGSLKANGQYKPITVNIGTHTGRPNEVLAGNHTLKAFRNLAEQDPFDNQWSEIAVHWVDVDEDMATRIVLVDNRSFDSGEFDADALVNLLNEVGTTGTGYTDADLDDLEAALDRPISSPPEKEDDDEPPAMPPAEDKAISFTITFDDEDQQDAWFSFIKWLKDRYPDPELTVSDRLAAHLSDTEENRL